MHRSNEENNGLKHFIKSVSSPSKNKFNSFNNNCSNDLESNDNQMEMSDRMEDDNENAKDKISLSSMPSDNQYQQNNHQNQILTDIINDKSNENIHLNSESANINSNKYFNYNNSNLNSNNSNTRKNNENHNQSAIFV